MLSPSTVLKTWPSKLILRTCRQPVQTPPETRPSYCLSAALR